MKTGQLKKMLIEAYTTEDYSGSVVDSFEVMFNPENYSRKYEVEYQDAQGAGDTASSQVYGNIKPQDYEFEITIDGTGVAADKVEVHSIVEHFLEVTGKNDGEIHRPRYLKLSWGKLLLKGVLRSANITFSLFKPDGSPLRAKIRFTIAENVEDTLRVAEADNNSPDLTHQRIVIQGDNLPLMVSKIYDSPFNYYLQVAEFNQLDNFRRLRVGARLLFPPVKNEKA
jgi:hypothetical protein